jgi:hypothetical protein
VVTDCLLGLEIVVRAANTEAQMSKLTNDPLSLLH